MTFQEVVKFHGHTCPGLAIGYRMATAALRFLSELRAEDEELVAIVENDACGVDAVQCLTGCTFGKGNLIFKDHGKQVYTFFCRNSKKAVRVALNESAFPQGIKGNREEWIKWLLSAPEEKVVSLIEVSIKEPDHAKKIASVRCEACGELVMETRALRINGKLACIPCSNTLKNV